jgi:hypothetical protein
VASSWGASWGTSWGVSWGDTVTPPDSPAVEPQPPVVAGIRAGAEPRKPAIVASLYIVERPDRLIATATVTVKEFDDALLDSDLLAIVMLT